MSRKKALHHLGLPFVQTTHTFVLCYLKGSSEKSLVVSLPGKERHRICEVKGAYTRDLGYRPTLCSLSKRLSFILTGKLKVAYLSASDTSPRVWANSLSSCIRILITSIGLVTETTNQRLQFDKNRKHFLWSWETNLVLYHLLCSNLLAAAVMLDIPASKNRVKSSRSWDRGAVVDILQAHESEEKKTIQPMNVFFPKWNPKPIYGSLISWLYMYTSGLCCVERVKCRAACQIWCPLYRGVPTPERNIFFSKSNTSNSMCKKDESMNILKIKDLLFHACVHVVTRAKEGLPRNVIQSENKQVVFFQW